MLVLFLATVATGWTVWSPRAEIAPRTYTDEVQTRSGQPALVLSGNSNPAVCGGYERLLPVKGAQWYRFSAAYKADGLDYGPLQVLARVNWEANGKRSGRPEYAWKTKSEGDWTRIMLDVQAPEDATAAKLQLLLLNAPRATVWWDDVKLDPIESPAPRKVTVAAIDYRPRKALDPVAAFVEMVDKTVAKADIIVLPEGITVVGTGKKYADVAETIPGPATAKLSEIARKKNSYVAAGIYEREGNTIYNTAVLLDRKGRFVGKYRKVYIPREEMEAGLTPGYDYPVFDTDFGKVGMMICWDVQYADPARALALRGAEIILMPIWGGNETLGKARAIENHVFIASSGYDYPTYVMDPNGEVLAQGQKGTGTAAITTIDLNRRYADPWLGDMRGRFMRELRLDIPSDVPGRR